jgi:hypothetical protein
VQRGRILDLGSRRAVGGAGGVDCQEEVDAGSPKGGGGGRWIAGRRSGIAGRKMMSYHTLPYR